ncbi:hypothetical protein PV08_00988 [Exophiala spinifera]|uniref:Uncharacterized protein n=1 Tax=Exophiala spinifera TaxID=91928 RepID=A0A0D2BN93_9EURO|nr:uncharacterized protein PV08_00988 [Exophiala spinifera]KIW20413.1 hypothetical protein PV08_00988 [Exophiala spinifera]
MAPSRPSVDADEARSPFAALAPRIKNISQTTIRKKWKPLPTSSQDKIRQILLNVKAKRRGGNARIPPLNKTRAGRASKANNKNALKEEELVSRLPRMPFPPAPTSSSQDDTPFDLSNTLHRISSLQSTLNMNTSSCHLLRRQIKREQRLLKRDRAELDALETSLRSANDLRRKKERGLHPVVRKLSEFEMDSDQLDQIDWINGITGISPNAALDDSISSNQNGLDENPIRDGGEDEEEDESMKSMLKQLRSHLTSMRNNTAGMHPVLSAMDETKAVLDSFAMKTFDHETLSKIYGVSG